MANKKTEEEALAESKKLRFNVAKEFPKTTVKWEEKCWYRYIPGNISVWMKFYKGALNTRVIDIGNVKKQIEKKEKEVLAISESADQGNPGNLKTSFAGIVFITFSETKYMIDVMEQYNKKKRKCRIHCCGFDICCCRKEEVKLERAAEPADVLWGNLSMSKNTVMCARRWSRWKTNALFVISLSLMYSINKGDGDGGGEAEEEDLGFDRRML